MSIISKSNTVVLLHLLVVASRLALALALVLLGATELQVENVKKVGKRVR